MGSNRDSTGDGRDACAELTGALQHARRRELVRCLCESDGELSLSSLTCQLTADADGSLAETVSALHDFHLPALTDRGLVEYDPETEIVALAVDLDAATAALEHADGG